MNIFDEILDHPGLVLLPHPFDVLDSDLRTGLSLYWNAATEILEGSGINLAQPPEDYYTLKKNFFSALFLYSYYAAHITPERRVLYVAVNQCLRGIVTGCDNILDNEYKKTLETDLPERATRFRSVLDILVSDRVLFHILLKEFGAKGFDLQRVSEAGSAILKALTRSGAQEASEEGGVLDVLPPEDVLRSIHHYKTGLLFQCPWAVPEILEELDGQTVAEQKAALYRIGMGCQILDDMVDFDRDIAERRHNYIVSLIFHESSPEERSKCMKRINGAATSTERPSDLLLELPQARGMAAAAARGFLIEGLQMLFAADLGHLVKPAAAVLVRLIGATRFIRGEI